MKMMTTLVMVLMLHLMHAQPEERISADKRAEIEKQKVAFIATQVDLTSEESTKFWPVYNAMNTEMKSLREEEHKARKEAAPQKDAAITAEVLDARMKRRFASDRNRIDVEEKYYTKFREVLPAEKVAAFYKAEHDFRRELIEKMRSRRGAGEGDRRD